MDPNPSMDPDSLIVENLIEKMVRDRDFAAKFLWAIRDLWTPEFVAWLGQPANCQVVSEINPGQFLQIAPPELPGDLDE